MNFIPNIRRQLTLSSDMLASETERKVLALNIDWVHPDPDQPRKHFDPAALDDLARSITEHGLLQPIVVRLPDPRQTTHFVIVAGERRYRAAKLAGLATIDALELTKGNPAELAVIENLQRENLTPLEEAVALDRLKQTRNYSLETLAKVIGKAQSSVSETMAIARLPQAILDEVQQAEAGTPKSTLIELVRLGDAQKQLALWSQIKGGASRQQIRALKKTTSPGPSRPAASAVLSTARRFAKALDAVTPTQLAADDLEQLQELTRTVIARLDEITYAKA